MADRVLVVVLDNDSLTGIFDIQGVPYGGTTPDVGAIVTVASTNPDLNGKLWVPKDGIIQIEELEAAIEAYVPAKKKNASKKSGKKTYKTKDTAAEE